MVTEVIISGNIMATASAQHQMSFSVSDEVWALDVNSGRLLHAGGIESSMPKLDISSNTGETWAMSTPVSNVLYSTSGVGLKHTRSVRFRTKISVVHVPCKIVTQSVAWVLDVVVKWAYKIVTQSVAWVLDVVAMMLEICGCWWWSNLFEEGGGRGLGRKL